MAATLFSRTAVTTGGVAVQGLARFVYTLVIGRVAGPEALGDTSALLSLAVYLSLFWPAATAIGASRFLPTRQGANYLSELKRSFRLSAVVLGLLALPLAFWVTGDLLVSIAAAALVLSYSGYVFVRGALLGKDMYWRATILDAISSATAVSALLLVLVLDVTWLLILPLAAGYALFTIAGWPRATRSRLPNTERAHLRSYLRHTTIGALATGGLLPATMIFIRGFDTAQYAGTFAAGLSLATPASLLSQSLNQVLLPHFARIQEEDPRALGRSMVRNTGISAAVFAAIFGALVPLSPYLLHWLFGAQFLDGASAMQVLLVVVFFISCTAAPSAYLMVVGKQRLYARLWLVAFLAGTALMAVLSPLLGGIGTLIGFAVGGIGGSSAVIVSALAEARRAHHGGSSESSVVSET